MSPQPPTPCDRCAGRGYLWQRLPSGEWKVGERCPACNGTGRAPEEE